MASRRQRIKSIARMPGDDVYIEWHTWQDATNLALSDDEAQVIVSTISTSQVMSLAQAKLLHPELAGSLLRIEIIRTNRGGEDGEA